MEYYNAGRLLSYNAILNFINSNRTYGKTWAFKIRAWRRAVKRGKKTIWVRRFKNEAQECAASFYSSKDLQKICGIVPYDKASDTGNFKQDGGTCYVRRNGRWEWFCKIVYLSKSAAMRSADDVAVDTIVFDEYTTTPERYARYRGNEVLDFIDLFFSAKREHVVRVFMLGNNESIVNPYFDYFGIPALPVDFEGIRTYKQGTIAVQKINNAQRKTDVYARGVAAMLDGTTYGDYIYQSAYKTAKRIRIAKTPDTATFYAQVVYDNNPLLIRCAGGLFFVESGVIDYARPVIVNKSMAKYPHEVLLTRQTKQWLDALHRAIVYDLVRYASAETYERAFGFIKYVAV